MVEETSETDGLKQVRNSPLRDELNRPLGIKPEKPAGSLNGNRLGILSILLACVAIVIAGFVLFYKNEQPIIIASDKNAATAVKENEAPSSTASSLDEADDDISNTQTDDSADQDGSLTPLEADSDLSVPEPNPARAEPQEAGLAHLPDPEFLERGATGVIPKRSADGRRPMDIYAREPDTTGNFGVARVVLIVGGIGISQTSSQQAIEHLPPAVTLAFAASGNSLARWMQSARKKGHELLLQVPMEAFGSKQNRPGDKIISSQISPEENLAILHWAMSRMTNYVGIMNYQGGKILDNMAALKPVFDDVADRGLLFIDDGTSGANHSEMAAAHSLLPFAKAHILLDGQRTRQAIAGQFELLVKEAKRTGLAIGVSNGFPEAIELISEFGKHADELGVEITPVSAIVNDPEKER